MFGLYAAEGDGAKPADAVPFTDIVLHGLVRDAEGKKMSKSRGNGIDPIDWVERYGADALRFTLARGANPGADLAVGDDAAQAARNFATKLFNATKLALLSEATTGDLPARDTLTDADRWILDRLDCVLDEVDVAFDRFEIGKASEALYHFAWDEFCDWYLELSKVQVSAGGERAVRTRAVLGHVLDALLRALHPVMPFVTETLWTTLTGGESAVVAAWPQHSGAAADPDAARRVADAQRLVTEVRRFRADQGLRPGQRVAARVGQLAEADLTGLLDHVTSLARLTAAGDDFTATASVEVRLSRATVTVELDTSGTVDVAAERARLTKELAAQRKELDTTSAKLANEAFLAKAPDAVVEKIRTRQQTAREEIARITERIDGLPGEAS